MKTLENFKLVCTKLKVFTECGDLTLRNEKVSGWSVGQQLDHSLKVIEQILPVILKQKKVSGKKLNFVGKLILAMGWIPRGRAKSPTFVLGEEVTKEGVAPRLELIMKLAQEVDSVKICNKEKIFIHPVLGIMNFNEALKFIIVHTQHHLKIISDIRKNNSDLKSVF